jgi:hypothetical protein
VAKHLPDRINEIVAESVQIQRVPKIFQSVRKSAVIFIFLSGVAIQAKPWLVASLFLIPAISLLLGIKPGNKFSKLKSDWSSKVSSPDEYRIGIYSNF